MPTLWQHYYSLTVNYQLFIFDIPSKMKSVYDACRNGETITSFTHVKLPIANKATIYGFAVYHDAVLSDIISCPPLGAAYVVGNRIVFSMENKIYRFPIFSSIEKPSEEKYPVYLLYVPRLMDLPYSSHVSAYLQTMRNEKPNLYVGKVDGIRLIDKKAFYFPNEDEYYFKSTSQFSGVGNAFVVITRRISELTGALTYEVYDPKEVEIIEE